MAAPFEVSNPYHSQGIAAGGSALLDAVNKAKVHLAKFILDAGESDVVNTQDFKGKTPLIRACSIREEKTRAHIIELLLARGANVNRQDDTGRTVLSYACELRCNDLIRILVKNNVDPDIPDLKGNTALIYSAMSGNDTAMEVIVRSFRRLGLNVDHVNSEGMTALLIAAKNGFIECASILALEGRASITFRDKENGYNAEDWARAYGCSNEQVLVLSPSMALLQSKVDMEAENANANLSPGHQRYLRGRRSFHVSGKVSDSELLEDLDELNVADTTSPGSEKHMYKRGSLPSVSFSSLRECSSARSSGSRGCHSRSSSAILEYPNKSAGAHSSSYNRQRKRVNTGTQTDLSPWSSVNTETGRPQSADALRVQRGGNNINMVGPVLCANCQAVISKTNGRRSQASPTSTTGTASGIQVSLGSDDETGDLE